MTVPPSLVVHGGAWNVPDGDVVAHVRGITAVLECWWPALRDGARALDVVEAAVRQLETDPTFNAGRGAHLNNAGRVELDASIMDGSELRAGAVAAIEGVRHPVSVARRVMEGSPHVLLVGAGAREFAIREGAELCPTEELLVGRELDRYRRIRAGEGSLVETEFRRETDPRAKLGTVGAVAHDRGGNVAAATSTGGTQDKAPGRVGDSPIIGAGTYADDQAGAVSSTGWGEGILRIGLARAAIESLRAGAPAEKAAEAAVTLLGRVDGKAGLIVVDLQGGAAVAFNTPRMARGIANSDGLWAGIEASESFP